MISAHTKAKGILVGVFLVGAYEIDELGELSDLLVDPLRKERASRRLSGN
jgi:hypothetical protein